MQIATPATAINSDADFPSEFDYMRILERFPRYSERGWRKNYLGDPQLGYFGDPNHEANGLRTMGNYVFTTALLASDPDYNPDVSQVSAATLLDRAKCGLRYMTRSHLTGDISCGNGRSWGQHWQSSWWTTKMALGARLIWDRLSEAERAAVERVVVFEASHHLDRILPSGLVEDTKAEENAWDTEILATAIALFPDHELSDRWREKLIEFNFNTLSVAQDRSSTAVVEHRVLKDQVYTINLHSDYTIENHGACHFCYVASPLLSIAWSYYALISQGQPVPESLFHHVEDLWNAVKHTFLDDRFAYIGGKDWARYTYGLYFIVPVLVMLQHRYGDTDARTIEIARVRTLLNEQLDNQDGSFFGKRISRNCFTGQSPKYEVGCYAKLGLAYLLHRQLQTDKCATPLPEFYQRISGRSISPESGTCSVRTPKLFASFSWRTLTQANPIALFIPTGMDNAAEWLANNLLGKVKVVGDVEPVAIRSMRATGAGFTVEGVLTYRTKRSEAFLHQFRYQVIPEQKLAIVESKFVAKNKIVVLQQEGLQLAIVNDRFNDYKRDYQWHNDHATIGFDPDQSLPPQGKLDRFKRKMAKLLSLNLKTWEMGCQWVNIDDKLGIIQLSASKAPFCLQQEPTRNTPSGCLHYDVLSSPKRSRYPQSRQAGDVLLHTKFMLVAGTAAETAALATSEVAAF